MKNIGKAVIKGVIIFVVFIAALFIVSNVMNKGNTDMTMEMGRAVYPTAAVRYDGKTINEMHGYADVMEVNYMRDSITPLVSGRRIDISINCHGESIGAIAFEVRSADGERLVENTEIEEFVKEDDRIELSFGLKDLIENNQEYVLVLILTMGNGQEIRYYTRAVFSEEYHTEEKLDFITDFSNRTFNKTAAEEITKYLESNSDGDNTTFGKVTIHSSFQQVTWGELGAERLTEPKITIKELAPQTGSFLMTYYVSAEEGENTNFYYVEEFYRVRYTADRMYLLDYERTLNRIFDESGEVYAGNKIMLGITGDEPPLAESDGGNAIAFITGNRLFGYNVADNKLAVLFSFYDKENQDERSLYDKHDIRILNVDEAGNVTFMVYGYMNRGRHEGKVGVSVYFYDSTVNTVEEMIYIPYYKSPELLAAEVEQLTYINKTGTLYLMFNNGIYGINVMEQSCNTVVQGLTEGSYKVSDSNRMIAWQNREGDAGGQELVFMNLNDGDKSVIKAGSGETIVPIDFMGDDLIYGIARNRDIVMDNAGNTIFPMYCVRIENETEGVLKEYRQENIYITGGSVSGNQITLQRVEKNEEGDYEETADHQIVNAEIAPQTQNKIEVVAVDTFEKITRIVLKNEIQKASMKLLTPKEVLFEGGRNVELTDDGTEMERYYVYGREGVEGIFTDAGNAVNLADTISGVVLNDRGAYVWIRGNRSLKNQIMAIQGEAVTEEKDSLAVCLDTMLAFEGIVRNSEFMLKRGDTVRMILEESLDDTQVLDLTGCSLDAVLYYVNKDIPVLVMLRDGSAVLLIGFNEANTVIMNPETGTVEKMGMNDSREWFEQSGNCFITYVRNQ